MKTTKKKFFILVLGIILTASFLQASDFSDYVYITNISFGGSVSDIFIRNQIGFVILLPQPGPITIHRLVIVSLTNPLQPAEISRIDYTVPYSSWGNIPTQIEVVGNFAYIANWHGGLQIIDVSNIYSPQLRGYYHQNVVDWGEAMEGILVDGNYAYIGWDDNYGLGIFDISNPDSPTKIANYDGISFARYVEKYNNYVYVSTYYGSYVRIFDVSNPVSPQLIGSIYTPGYTYYLGDIKDSKLYLSGGREDYGLKIYDLSINPSNPSLLGQINTSSFGNAHDIEVRGKTAFQVYSLPILAIFDVTNPANIQLLKHINIRYGATKFDISDSKFIYIPQGVNGLGIVGVPYITATINIDPDTLNLKSKGNWITCYIEFPTGYNVQDINISTVKITKIGDNSITPIYCEPTLTRIGDEDTDGISDLMVKFNCEAVQNAIRCNYDSIKITVEGDTVNNRFVGFDLIRTIQGENCGSGSGNVEISSEKLSGKKKFNPAIGENYIIETEGIATVKIYTITGRLVRELSSSNGQVIWDGREKDGSLAPNGVYIIEINGIGEPKYQKVALIK